MRIINWNVNGLYNTLKDAGHRYDSVSNYFSHVLRADILCFQEAKIQEEKLEKWMACVPGYESFWAFCLVKKGYSGVVTYVKENFSPFNAKADYLGYFDRKSEENLCHEGRLMETDHGSFVLINVYVPNAGEQTEGRARLNFKLHFLKALKLRCDDLVISGKEIVVLGDFNIAHRDIDVFNEWDIHEIYTPEEISWMDEFFRDYVDLFRYFHPDARDVFSVWDAKKEARIHNEGLRIDYAACSKGFLDQVIDAEIVKMVPKSWSDHAAIVLTLKEQPVLPVHPIPALSSRSMKRFKEDHRQKKLTDLFGGRSLKSMPSSAMELVSNETQECLSLKSTEITLRKDIDLGKGHSERSNALSKKSMKDDLDVNNSYGSKDTGPAHLSRVVALTHLYVDLNDEKQRNLVCSNSSELVENAEFDQKNKTGSQFTHALSKNAISFDTDEMTISENANNQFTDSQQKNFTNSMAASLECAHSALAGQACEEMNGKLNRLAEAASSRDTNVPKNTLREALASNQQKSKGSKKRKPAEVNLTGHTGKQKGLKSYFKMQNG